MHNEATNLIPVNAMVRDKSEFERLELVSSMRRVAEDAARQWVSAKAASCGPADLGLGAAETYLSALAALNAGFAAGAECPAADA